MRKRTEKEYVHRQSMIDYIEGTAGIWKAVWNEWRTEDIAKLYQCLKTLDRVRKTAGIKWSDMEKSK